MNPRSLRALVRSLPLLVAAPALAGFALYDASGFAWLGYTWNKWGNPTAGTPATVYWSLMPAGTAGSDYCAPGCTSGTGNRCDGDLSNNGATNAQDTALFRGLLGSPPGPSGLVPQ